MNKQRKNNILNMKTKLIRLTEGDLHRIIKDSVNRILRESEEYILINGQNVPIEQAMTLAKQELVNYLQSNVIPISVSSYEGEGYGSIEIDTESGWYFLAEDFPVDLVIDSYSSYSPATRWDPEEYNEVEGHIENIDFSGDIECYPPSDLPFGQRPVVILTIDDELKKLLNENCKADDISGALASMEEYDKDHYPEPDYERDDFDD